MIEAVADREGVDPVELSPPLHSAIDPEALDVLVRSMGDGPACSVEFSYAGYAVRVDGSGAVRVTEAPIATTGSRSPADTIGD